MKIPRPPPQNQKSHIKNLKFEVSDTGIGIPPEHLQDIFSPFYQVNRKGDKEAGTGLGLAISQQLAGVMGSTIHVKSLVGQGTTFWFELSLPVVERSLVQGTIPPEHQIIGFKGRARKILIVDDHAENRAFIRNVLTPLGFDIQEAADGSDALHKTQECSPDLILMDLLMPGMDGFEAARLIREAESRKQEAEGGRQKAEGRRQEAGGREQKAEGGRQEAEGRFQDGNSAIDNQQSTIINPQSPIPIIGVSASVTETMRERSRIAGFQAFLPKPIRLEELLDCVRKYLDLEWVSEDNVPAECMEQTSSSFVLPPEAVLQEVLELAQGGYIDDIQEVSAQLKISYPEFEPFVSQIEEFVEEYDTERIVKYLRQELQELRGKRE